MRATIWFRVAAAILVLFAVGHTVGFVSFHGSTPEALALRAQMDAVHFGAKPGDAATLSFGGFYVGFGLFLTAFQMFAAWVAWRLGGMARRGSTEVAALGWPMVALMLISAGLALKYFFIAPILLSVMAAGCLVTGIWLTPKEVDK